MESTVVELMLVTLSLSEENGLGRYSANFIRALPEDCRLTVFTGKDPSIDPRLVRRLGEGLHAVLPGLSEMMNPAVSLSWGIRLAGSARRADVVHALMDYPHNFAAAVASILARKPLLVSAVGTYSVAPFSSAIHSRLLAFALRRAFRVICISEYTRSQVLQHISLNNACIVPLGVDPGKFCPISEISRPGQKPIVLSVGMLKSRKGFDILLKAIVRVRERIPDVTCYIIGDRSNAMAYQALTELAASLGVSDSVHFLGQVSENELIAWYNRCDVFALPARSQEGRLEGFGLVYLEANACGKPVVGCRDTGAEEPIIDGYNGFLVPQEDPDALAEAIMKALGDPALAAKMGRNGRQRAEELSWQRVAERVSELYRLAIRGENKR